MLWVDRGAAVPDDDHLVPLGAGRRQARRARDVTVVGIAARLRARAGGRRASSPSEGIEAEVIDPRTLVPLDWPTILASVRKTGRLVVVDPATRTCSAASEIAAHVAEECFDDLRAPIVRVTTDDTHVPFSPALEKQIYPSKDKVLAAVARVLASTSAEGSS